jgi:hypothetical protein
MDHGNDGRPPINIFPDPREQELNNREPPIMHSCRSYNKDCEVFDPPKARRTAGSYEYYDEDFSMHRKRT